MAMACANQEAERLDHDYIGSEHILFGLLNQSPSMAVAALHNLRVDVQVLRKETDLCLADRQRVGQSGKPPHSPESKVVIEAAIAEARGLRHGFVGTEHLLLGLLQNEDSRAGQLLSRFGLSLEPVRHQAKELVGQLAPTDLAQRLS